MSLAAVMAPPLRSRRPPHRPRAADAPTERDWIKALTLRMVKGLSEREAARTLDIDRKTLRRWCRKAYATQAGKQILAGPDE